MATQTGNSHFNFHHELDERVDALKAGVHKLVERVTTTPSGEPTRLRTWIANGGDAIKEHPFAAIGIAAALGYVVVRLARR